MYYTADSGRKKESRRMRQVKVAAIQMQCSKNPEENRKKAEKMIRKAAGDGANIILLPELFEREYFCQQRRYDFYHYAKPLEENEAVLMGQRLAKELGVVLPISFYEKEVNNLYNSIACIDADGTILGVYRKTHIPDDHYYQEKFYFTCLSNQIWHNWNWNLLGPVVSGNCKKHGTFRRRTFILSDSNWFGTDFGM